MSPVTPIRTKEILIGVLDQLVGFRRNPTDLFLANNLVLGQNGTRLQLYFHDLHSDHSEYNLYRGLNKTYTPTTRSINLGAGCVKLPE